MPQLLVEALHSRARAASSWASQAVLATSKGTHQEDEGSGVASSLLESNFTEGEKNVLLPIG